MRVTHVITRLIVGGAQENTVSTVLGFQGKPNWEVDLLSGPTSGPEGTLEPLFEKYPGALSIVPSLVRPVQPVLDLKCYFALRKIFRATRPSIVHTHSSKAGVLGRLAAHHTRVPLIVHTIHGPAFGEWQGRLSNIIFKGAEKAADSATTHYITVADAMRDQYLAAGIGTPNKYTRIFSGFNLEPFRTASNDLNLRKQYGLSSQDIVVGKIARMFELKGHDDLFAVVPELVRKNPRLKFLLIGGGPWEERFRKLAKDMGLENHFAFTGLVAPKEIPSLVGIIDFLVHLSFREGLPRALPQALAAGKPVVAYDCDGAREIAIPGKTGFLVRCRDHAGLVDAILTLSDNEPLRVQLGKQGQTLVSECFSVERMVDEIEELYFQLLQSAGSPVVSAK